MSLWLFGISAMLAAALAYRGRSMAAVMLLLTVLLVETGIAELPWLFVLFGVGVLGNLSGGRKLSILVVVLMGLILISGLWDRALLSLYLSGVSVFACAVVGGGIGLLSAVSPLAWRIVRPVCDMLQTIPLFVFLIPVLMFFQIGEFSAFLAICAYAIVPMIRYTQHGLTTTPHELLDAAMEWARKLCERAPLSLAATKRCMRHAAAADWASTPAATAVPQPPFPRDQATTSGNESP